MIISKTLKIIETHTAGNPTRHILAGAPAILGNSMAEKMTYMRDNYDWIRRISMMEPRGHSCMSGTLYVSPCNPEADMGILYFDASNYMTMCGHSTIAVATVLVETGIVPMMEPLTEVKLDTPAGLVVAQVSAKNHCVESVSFNNVPSFLYDVKEIEIEGYGKVHAEVAFGGMAYVIVNADDFSVEIRPDNANELARVAHLIHKAADKQIGFQHPEKPFMNRIHSVMLYGKPTVKGADIKEVVVVIPEVKGNATSIDRSPCGTGSSARIAAEYAMNRIALDQAVVHQSIIDTTFEGKIVKEVKVGRYRGGIPQIKGSAYITAHIDLVVDPFDSIQDGFIVG